MKKCVLIVIASLLATPPLFADSLTPIEKKIDDYALHSTEQQIKTLEKMVNINSITTNLSGVKRVGELLRPLFKQLGFTTKWVDEPPSMHRAPTLVATRIGTQGKRLLLIAHLDTVAAVQDTAHFVRHAHSASGAGVVDDKGGIAVLLYALKALHDAHALDHTTITVVLPGDEEDSGKPTSISRRPLFDAAKQSDVALDFEDAVSEHTASISRRGIAMWSLQTSGREGHSSGIFQNDIGDGAIFELSRILNTMRTTLSSEKYLSFSPGITLGGTTIHYNAQLSRGDAFGKENVIAQTALARGDLRYVSDEQKQSTQQKMQDIVAQHLPNTKATLTFTDGIPAMPPTANNEALLKQYSEASEALGLGKVVALDPLLRGAGDISHIAAMVSANLVGLGPLGSGEHSAKESLDLSSLPLQTRRAALLMYRLTR